MDRYKKKFWWAVAGYCVFVAAVAVVALFWSSKAVGLSFVPFLTGLVCDLRLRYLRREAGLEGRWEWCVNAPFGLFDPLPQYPDIELVRRLTLLSFGMWPLLFCLTMGIITM